MSTNQQDLDLASRMAGGSPEAAEEFTRVFRPLIISLARRRGVPTGDCEDVAQNVLLDACRQLQRGNYRGDCALKTWVRHLALGGIADYWRKPHAGAKMLVPLSEDDGDVQAADGQVTRAGDLPAVASDAETVVIVRRALAAMPAEHRYILLFNRTAKYTIEEISQALGLTPAQVARRLYRAEEMFRQLVTTGSSDTSGKAKSKGGLSRGSGILVTLLLRLSPGVI